MDTKGVNTVQTRVEYQCRGMTKTVKEWARHMNISWSTLYKWLQAGWTLEEIMDDKVYEDRKLKHKAKKSFSSVAEMLQWLYEQNIDDLKKYDADIKLVDPTKWDLMGDGIPMQSEVPGLEPRIYRVGDLVLCDMVYLAQRFNIPVGLCQLFLLNLKVPVLHLGDCAYFNLKTFETRLEFYSGDGGPGFKVRQFKITTRALQNSYGIPQSLAYSLSRKVHAFRQDAEARRRLKEQASAEMPLLRRHDSAGILIQREIERVYGDES